MAETMNKAQAATMFALHGENRGWDMPHVFPSPIPGNFQVDSPSPDGRSISMYEIWPDGSWEPLRYAEYR